MERLSSPHPPEIEELLGAYALDALDPDEARLVDAHLAACPRCRQEVAAHLEVAGKLGSLGQEAPPLVWDRIAANLAPTPQNLSTSPPRPVSVLGSAPARSRGSRSRRGWIFVGAAGLVAAAVIVVLGIGVIQLNKRVNNVSLQLRRQQAPTLASVGAAISAPGSQQVALTPLGGGAALAQVVIDRDGVGYMYDSRMPALASDRTYELWGIVDDVRVPYGVLGADPSNVIEFVAKGQAATLAVTVERAGGVTTSTNIPLALGDLTA